MSQNEVQNAIQNESCEMISGLLHFPAPIPKLRLKERLSKLMHFAKPLAVSDLSVIDPAPATPISERSSDVTSLRIPDTSQPRPVRHSRSATIMTDGHESLVSSRARASSNRTLPPYLEYADSSVYQPEAAAMHYYPPDAALPLPHLYLTSSGTNSDTESGVAFLEEHVDKNTNDPLACLPTEIVEQIFAFLDPPMLTACSLVSWLWYMRANSNSVWRTQFGYERTWQTKDNLPDDISWKNLYKTRLELERRWKSGKCRAETLLGHSDRVYCVFFDNKKIVTGSSDRTIKVWDYKTGALLHTLGKWSGRDGLSLLSGNANFGNRYNIDRSAISANVTSDSIMMPPLRNVDGDIYHEGSVLCLYFDEELMITGSSDRTCIVWQLPEFKPLKKVLFHSGPVLDVCLGDDCVVSCSKDGSILIWDRKGPDYTIRHRLLGHRGPVNALQVRGDMLISAGGDTVVKLWSIPEGTCLRNFRGHTRGLACVSFSPDGSKIVSGGNDNVIRMWSTETGECLHVLTGHKSLVRSLDVHSNRIVSGSYDQVIKIWDLSTGQLTCDLVGFHGSWIFGTRADCRRIVSTSMGIKPIILDFAAGLDEECLQYLIG